MHAEQFFVDVTGDLPLYKESKVEKEIKQWLSQHIKEFEKDFKIAMQVSEREIMNSFAFKTNLNYGGALHATLGETMHLTD